MITAILSIVAYLLPLIFEWWQEGAPQRTKEACNAKIQKGRSDIANGDVSAVSVRIDRVQPVQAGASSGGASGIGAGASQAGDADTLRRLAALGCIPGKTPGSCGTGGEV